MKKVYVHAKNFVVPTHELDSEFYAKDIICFIRHMSGQCLQIKGPAMVTSAGEAYCDMHNIK